MKNLLREIVAPRRFLLNIAPEHLPPVISPSDNNPRVWRDLQGRTITAVLIRAKEKSVLFRLENNKSVELPIEKRSTPDRAFTKKWLSSQAGIVAAENKLAEMKEDLPKGVSEKALPETTGTPEKFEAVVVKEDADNEKFEYARAHFRFISERRLSSRLISKFTILYEATYTGV